MPIFNTNEEVPQSNPIEPAPVIDTASVYHNREMKNKIIAFISGSTWTVDYYAKYQGDDDVLSNGSDVGSPTLLQYQKIEKMELRLQGSLEQATDTQTNTTSVTGSALVYPIVIPQIGDVIVAHVGANSYGIFDVVTVARQSLYKESAWLIEVNMSDYLTDVKQAELEDKVVNTLIFDITQLNTDKGPIRTESEYQRNVDRCALINELVSCLYNEYYNTYHQTFLVKDVKMCFDPFAVDFFNKIVGTEFLGGRATPRLYDFRNTIFQYEYSTIWDAILTNSRRTVLKGVKEMGNRSTFQFGTCYLFNTIDTTQLECVVYPGDDGCCDGGRPITTLGNPDLYLYVLSEAFYTEDSDNYTAMDRWVWDMIDRKIPVYTELVEYADNVLSTQTGKERFYNTLLLIALLMISR